jgi:predicted nuclease with RNAse H fold
VAVEVRATAYAGIDVAVAKKKRLPIVVCTWQSDRIVPLALNAKGLPKPPRGPGNVAICDLAGCQELAAQTASYLRAVESALGIDIQAVAIDAPSAPRAPGQPLRAAERALAARGISYIETPSADAFAAIPDRIQAHLAAGGRQSTLPCANQIWMLFGFELYRVLAAAGWACLEVYPQATVRALGAADIHKSEDGAVLTQLQAAAKYTNWPQEPNVSALKSIGWGTSHDRLDAYLAAWVAALPRERREGLGEEPDDVIWIPRVRGGFLGGPAGERCAYGGGAA